jgi:hypothetical protein
MIGLALVGALLMAPGAMAGPTGPDVAPPLSSERMQAAYWDELAAALAGSEDARDLLTAALVTARPWEDAPPDEGRVADLLARAERAAPADPLVWWVAASRCEPAGPRCHGARAAARAHLLRLDPDNAVNWLLAAAQAWSAGAKAEAHGALAKAAASSHADDHLVALALMVAARIEAHPPAPALLRASGEGTPGFALAGAMAFVAPLATMPLQILFEACSARGLPAVDPDCLAVARLLQDGNSLFSARIGLGLERRILDTPNGSFAAEQRQRELDWMGVQYLRLGEETAPAAAWLASLRRSGSEQRALEDVLAARGVALQPSADWSGPWME